MIAISLKKLCSIVHGIIINKTKLNIDNLVFSDISTNSKKIIPGCLFIALVGKRFDAHNFVRESVEKGASAILLQHEMNENIPQIIVKNTTIALGNIALWNRKKSNANVIALTGSSGKTSVKEMTNAILKNYGKTLSTFKNFNNNIGVPLTLLNIDTLHKYVIIEIGANHPKEILYSTKLANPNIVLINNICHSHLDGFKSLLGVSKAKQEILSGLSKTGTAIFNADSHHWSRWKKSVKNNNILWFSIKKKPIIC
ncbi:MAG: Mur ligase family protein [Buchnera aphidicola (Schlechtendalia peitan)]